MRQIRFTRLSECSQGLRQAGTDGIVGENFIVINVSEIVSDSFEEEGFAGNDCEKRKGCYENDDSNCQAP